MQTQGAEGGLRVLEPMSLESVSSEKSPEPSNGRSCIMVCISWDSPEAFNQEMRCIAITDANTLAAESRPSGGLTITVNSWA